MWKPWCTFHLFNGCSQLEKIIYNITTINEISVLKLFHLCYCLRANIRCDSIETPLLDAIASSSTSAHRLQIGSCCCRNQGSEIDFLYFFFVLKPEVLEPSIFQRPCSETFEWIDDFLLEIDKGVIQNIPPTFLYLSYILWYSTDMSCLKEENLIFQHKNHKQPRLSNN